MKPYDTKITQMEDLTIKKWPWKHMLTECPSLFISLNKESQVEISNLDQSYGVR